MRQNGKLTDGTSAETSITSTTEFLLVDIPGHHYTMKKVAAGTFLGNATAGTVEASKAIVADSNKDITGLRNVTITGNFITGTTTLSETDLAKIDGITNGTQAAGKAVVADSNVNTGVSKVTELHIGTSGSEVQVTSTPAVLNRVVNCPGNMAMAYIDFNAAGEAAMTITIDGVVYTEADTEDFPNGTWTNGASAADSATSLISAINGDTRATVPFTAVADTSGDGVMLFWDAVGTAGNVTITTDSASNCTVQNSTGGEAAAAKQVSNITHTVNTQELLSGAIEIPIPFTPTGFNINAVSSAGVPVYFTDTVAIAASPARIKITTAGATNLANTDIIHMTVWE